MPPNGRLFGSEKNSIIFCESGTPWWPAEKWGFQHIITIGLSANLLSNIQTLINPDLYVKTTYLNFSQHLSTFIVARDCIPDMYHFHFAGFKCCHYNAVFPYEGGRGFRFHWYRAIRGEPWTFLDHRNKNDFWCSEDL